MKLHYDITVRPKMRMINKIVKNKKKYSRKFLERNIDYGYINCLLNMKFPDNPCYCTKSEILCEIFETQQMGKGVRTRKSLPAGTEIGCYYGNIVPSNTISKTNYYSFYYILRGFAIDGSVNQGMMSFMNHAEEPNVSTFFKFHWIENNPEIHLTFFTNKDVEIGEELFINYGEEFWEGHIEKINYNFYYG